MGLSFDDAHRGLRGVNAGILRPNKRSPGVFRWITAVVWLRRAAVPIMSTVVSRKCASRVLFRPARSSVLLWKTPVLLKRFMVRRPRKLWYISSPRMVEPKKTPSGSRTAAAFLNTRNENSHVRHEGNTLLAQDMRDLVLPCASWSLTFSCQLMPDIWSRKLRGPSVAGRP
jgi:hypothetical protein